MANFNELVRAVAEIEGLDEMTVSGIGQNAREAGFISKGGRGRSAAMMSARDAANLLIAVNASAKAKDAAKAVATYDGLRMTHDMSDLVTLPPGMTGVAGYEDAEWDRILHKGCRFGDALAAMLVLCMPGPDGEPMLLVRGDGPNRMSLTIEFSRPHPEILIEGEDTSGFGREFEGEHIPRPLLFAKFTTAAPRPVGVGDRRDRTSISSRTLLAVGRALAA